MQRYKFLRLKNHSWKTECVWWASVSYIDGHYDSYPVKVPSNLPPTPSGFMNFHIFLIGAVRYAAFGQAGFGVDKVTLSWKNIRYCKRTKMYEVLPS